MSTNPKTPGLWTMTRGEFEKSVERLEAAIVKLGGDLVVVFDRFRTDPAFTARVAEFTLRYGLDLLNHRSIRAVMGQNLWGIDEWSFFYGVVFTEEQLCEVGDFPWSEDVLNSPCPFVKGRSIRETHFAFLGVPNINGKPFTITRWYQFHSKSVKQRYFANNSCKSWSMTQEFARETTCTLRWYLMPLEVDRSRTVESYQEQVVGLPQDYEVPHAIEEFTKDILYYRRNGIRLNSSLRARCKDVFSDYFHIYVGSDTDGLEIDYYPDSSLDVCLGIAASRKLPVQVTK